MTRPEVVVLFAWAVVGGDNLWRAWRARRRTSERGVVRLTAGGLVLVGLAVASQQMERMADRWTASPVLVIVGMLSALLGAAVHLHARHTLGNQWATSIRPTATDAPVTDGLYGRVRHPLYAAIRLLSVGLVCVHPSPATFCLTAGLMAGTGIKARAEERALTAAFPELYPPYAARTPRFCPHHAPGPKPT